MLGRIASSRLRIPALLLRHSRTGSLRQADHPAFSYPRAQGSTPMSFVVGRARVNIRLFEAVDKRICSLDTLDRVLLLERKETELFWCTPVVVLLMTTCRVLTLDDERTRRCIARSATAFVFMEEERK